MRQKESGHECTTKTYPRPNPSAPASIHQSVLLAETISLLAPHDGGTYVDGTMGMGGHTERILELSAPTGKAIGFEWDANAREIATERLRQYGTRLQVVSKNFAQLGEGLAELGLDKVDGLILDLGLSSLQLDGEGGKGSGRGFSFQRHEPLDMRMDSSRQLTAAELINQADEDELADILYYYGDERHARRIASCIVQARKKGPVETSDQLARIVSESIPKRFHPKKIHVATKVFQAIRIAVNKELNNLSIILETAPAFLKPGARFCIITFHSLEDRMVKQQFKGNPLYEVLTKKPITPTKEECLQNHRARSAKLRAAAVKNLEDTIC